MTDVDSALKVRVRIEAYAQQFQVTFVQPVPISYAENVLRFVMEGYVFYLNSCCKLQRMRGEIVLNTNIISYH